MTLYDHELCVSAEDVEAVRCGYPWAAWAEFILNPRRLRGSDFLMRWSQGRWSEDRLVEAVNATKTFWALPYGPSSVAPDGNPREFELYFERLEDAGLSDMKRPDLLVLRAADMEEAQTIVEALGGAGELPFTRETEHSMQQLLDLAIVAVECENSLWVCAQMPDFGKPLKAQPRLGGKLGLPKSAVAPTVIIKQEDRLALGAWEATNRVPIHVWHAFYDRAYGLARSRAEDLIDEGCVEPTSQTFQAPGGATSTKVIYKFLYHFAYELGLTAADVTLVADKIVDKNGHILPFVRFEGGSLTLSEAALAVLGSCQPRSQYPPVLQTQSGRRVREPGVSRSLFDEAS